MVETDTDWTETGDLNGARWGPRYPALAKSTQIPIVKPDLETAVLPGHGDPGPDCGSPVMYHCRTCGETFPVDSSCMMRECPSCYQKWAGAEGRRAGLRTWYGARLVLEKRGLRRVRVVHCIVSRERRPDDDLETVRKWAIRTVKRHGIRGGLIVVHPWRQDDDERFVPDGHIHVHVVGMADGDIRAGDGSDGTVFKHIPNPKTGDFRGFQRARDVGACVKYLLTHCAVVKDRHALTWFGWLSYNMLSSETLEKYAPETVETERKNPPCPSCGSSDTEPCVVVDRTAWPSDRVRVWPDDPPDPPGPVGPSYFWDGADDER